MTLAAKPEAGRARSNGERAASACATWARSCVTRWRATTKASRAPPASPAARSTPSKKIASAGPQMAGKPAPSAKRCTANAKAAACGTQSKAAAANNRLALSGRRASTICGLFDKRGCSM